ncbi:glycosyltransferase family 2 protein [Xanthobacter tagetidis]|nr:glycosyltransferase family A protein [Xanthobacter tagetidis]MBB6309808.1 glycosyltransferase involved in cell wall biosynthesis [Xanthobacter tagetidis]
MRVSVLIACWNAQAYIGEAIRSALDQDPAPAELIVVDDGSTDASADVAGAIGGVTLLRQANQGVGAALNAAAAQASGDVLAFLDADDLWCPGKLAAQTAALAAEPELDAVFGHMAPFASPDLPEQERAGLRIGTAAEPGFVKGTMLLRRAAFERLGSFNETRLFADFIAWYAQACIAGFHWRMLDHLVLLRRIHGANMGRRERPRQREDYLGIMKALIDAKRGARS